MGRTPPKWSGDELALLRELWTKTSSDALLSALPDRTFDACRAKALELKIGRNRRGICSGPYTEAERRALLAMWGKVSTAALEAALPGRTLRGMQAYLTRTANAPRPRQDLSGAAAASFGPAYPRHRVPGAQAYDAALAAVPRTCGEAREDVVADMLVAYCAGEIAVEDFARRAPDYIRAHAKATGAWRLRSLDARMVGFDRMTLGETISGDDYAERWSALA